MLHTSQAPASAPDDFIPSFHETFTACVLSCDRDELHCGGEVVMWCGVVVRAVGGGDMKIDVAVAPISCSGNFLTNHAAAWAGLGLAGLPGLGRAPPIQKQLPAAPGHGRDVIRNSLATANNAHI